MWIFLVGIPPSFIKNLLDFKKLDNWWLSGESWGKNGLLLALIFILGTIMPGAISVRTAILATVVPVVRILRLDPKKILM